MMERQNKAPIRQWGSIIYHYRWAVVSIWVFLIVFLGIFALRTPSLLQDTGFTPTGSSSVRGIAFIEEKLGMSAVSLDLVVESTLGRNLTTYEAQAKVWEELAPLRKQPFVQDMYASIVTRKTGEDGIISYTVLLNETTNQALAHFEEIKAAVPEVSGARVYITGNLAVYHDMSSAVRHDIVRAESFGIPAALIILLLLFGTFPAALLPVAVGIGSVAVAMGSLYFVAAQGVPLSNFLPNMVTMLGLAVGIDYALFMVSRFREELGSKSVEAALVATCQTVGRSVWYSGAAVMAGMLALGFIRIPIFQSLALGGMLVVLVSVLAASTLLPALLGILGQRIHSWPIRFRGRNGQRDNSGSVIWIRISEFIMSRPGVIAVVATVALLAAMQPALHMKLGIPSAEVLPPSYDSRYGAELMKKAYDMKEANAIVIAIELDQSYDDPGSIRLMKTYMSRLEQLAGVHHVESYASFLKEVSDDISPELQAEIEKRYAARGNAAIIIVVPEAGETAPATVKLVQDIRQNPPEGMHIEVTGSPAYKLDFMDRIQSGIPYVLVTVLLLTYIVLFAAFRSVLLPLKAVAMNLLSLGASFGLITLVFQKGYGAHLLQVTYTGSVFAILPILIFCVVFGISMDYEVMMLSRIVEAYQKERNNERSTAIGLQRTGGMITGAALILAVVAGAFMFTDNELMKALGLGLSASVLIDVTVVRILLVPSLMKLMGKANWWLPGWLSFLARPEPEASGESSH
ncbi:MMPL family transporter [Paenibacillus sp.]|jgi:RND superfamily putative drug exporter|uniref:MMPL family transporter n=1 Tax=Paenibacillus sp. TaxID=58172 RepID=UPI00282A8E1D|nr:MMPL family transporter [Paenibacillus sp.]MDR0270962.1 MMPL family transporter [Paenibacillus sp.]